MRRASPSRVRGFAFRAAVAVSRNVNVMLLLMAVIAGCHRKPSYEDKSVAELETMVRSSDRATQLQGLHGLSLLGPDARDAVPALSEALASDEPTVRAAAA